MKKFAVAHGELGFKRIDASERAVDVGLLVEQFRQLLEGGQFDFHISFRFVSFCLRRDCL